MSVNCSKGILGEPGIKNDLVSFFINNTDKSMSAFLNGEAIPIENILDFSIDNGKLTISIDIKRLEYKHNIKGSQVSLLYKQE